MYRLRSFIPKNEPIEIVPVGDVHYGSPNCNLKYFKSTIQHIKDTPHCYMIGMGDLWDSILPKDKRYDPDQAFKTIDESYQDILKILEPIKEKIICFVTGNHEYHLHTDGYGDLTKRLSYELNTGYGGFSCFLRIETKEHPIRAITGYIHHGWVAGRQRGGKVSALEAISRDYSADFYLMGHSHDLFATRRVRISWQGVKNVVFANTGTFLETATWNTAGYGERAGYPPQRLGTIKLLWHPDKEEIGFAE